MSTPVITIFVRHSADCKYAGDEFEKRCRCRKHFRWSANGKQYRQKAGTRSWSEAETNKRRLEDQLAGRAPEIQAEANAAKTLADAVDTFKKDKKNQGVTEGVLDKYTRELDRLQRFMESQQVFTVSAITGELLVSYQSKWSALYPSGYTRQMVQARLKNFLRFCYDNAWLERVPRLSTIKSEEVPTLPLTDAEYKKLLDRIPVSFPDHKKARRFRALIRLMRHSGLAIRDAVTLRRDELIHDKVKKIHRIVTNRQKTRSEERRVG